MKAIIVNRFGDFGIYFALLLMFFFFRSFDFGVVFNMSDLVYNSSPLTVFSMKLNKLDLVAFFLFLGAVGKSAQLGLHT
jgi:NADH:ubiquinone oxidoreductase subunit 5 (subunit L)/multisubunit Na+/H+ antiporter MnhA subunit